jgi:hypothetical protein
VTWQGAACEVVVCEVVCEVVVCGEAGAPGIQLALTRQLAERRVILHWNTYGF